MSKNDGGNAFPVISGQIVYGYGMSLRDYFAGQALAGDNLPARPHERARRCFEIADAMLAERERKTNAD
jgi:hypothetical protein